MVTDMCLLRWYAMVQQAKEGIEWVALYPMIREISFLSLSGVVGSNAAGRMGVNGLI